MIWDRRASNRPVAGTMYMESVDAGEVPWGAALKLKSVINEDNGSYIKSLRFNRDQRGVLGILSSAGELNVYELRKEYLDDEFYTNPVISPELLEVRKSQNLESPPNVASNASSNIGERIVSFDWLTLGTAHVQSRVVALRANGKLDILETRKPQSELGMSLMNFSGGSYEQQAYFEQPVFPEFNDFREVLGPLYQSHDAVLGNSSQTALESTEAATAVAIQQAYETQRNVPVRQLNYVHPIKIADRIIELRAKSKSIYDVQKNEEVKGKSPSAIESSALDVRPLSSREQHRRSHYFSIWPQSEEELRLLTDVHEWRALEGYHFGCKRNKKIVADDPWLQDVWEWIGGKKYGLEATNDVADNRRCSRGCQGRRHDV
jgi:hypothetical protein